MVEVFDAGSIDGLGVLYALVAAVTFAIYLVGFERAGRSYDAFTTLTWGLGFATLFWLLVSPPWSFPFGDLDSVGDVALAAGVVVIGTLAPFLLNLSALRHLPAARVGVVATLEPVLATLVALGDPRRGADRHPDRGRAARGGRGGVGAEPPALPGSRGCPRMAKDRAGSSRITE